MSRDVALGAARFAPAPDDGRPARRPSGSAADLAARALRAGSLLVCLAILALFTVGAPGFLSPVNIGLVLSQSAVLGLLGLGLTLVLITGGTDVIAGGIDLSLAGTLGLSAAVFAVASRAGWSDPAAVAAALATGLGVGAVNAVAVLLLGIPPLLATLATMNVAAGLELVLTGNSTVPAASALVDWLGGPGPLGVPVSGWVLVGVTAALALGLGLSRVGLRATAVGSHREAAEAAGLSIRRYVAGSYLASGLFGALAGLVSVAFLSGSTTGSADMLLPTVATAFLGVVFSRRLVPTVPGTFAAAVFLGALANGFQLLHASTYWVNGIEGALILAVVGATSGLARERRR